MEEVIKVQKDANFYTAKNGDLAVKEIHKNMFEFYRYNMSDEEYS